MGLPEDVGTVQQVHCNRRRLLQRGLEFHVCTIIKFSYRKSLETYRMHLVYIYIYIIYIYYIYIYIYIVRHIPLLKVRLPIIELSQQDRSEPTQEYDANNQGNTMACPA